MERSKDRMPRKRCQTCLKHENGKRAKDSTEAKPADSELQSPVNKDGSAFSRKTVHSNK